MRLQENLEGAWLHRQKSLRSQFVLRVTFLKRLHQRNIVHLQRLDALFRARQVLLVIDEVNTMFRSPGPGTFSFLRRAPPAAPSASSSAGRPGARSFFRFRLYRRRSLQVNTKYSFCIIFQNLPDY